MMKAIRASCRFDDQIYVIPYREHRRHLYEDAQKDLFPSILPISAWNRSLARAVRGAFSSNGDPSSSS